MQSAELICVGAGGLLLMGLQPSMARASQDQAPQDRAPQYIVTELPTLGGSVASGNTISDIGMVMGNANLTGDQVTHAAIWRELFVKDLGTLGGPNSFIQWQVHNANGVIAGFAETAAIDQYGENWSCGYFFPSFTGHVCVGFRYEHNTMTALPTLGGPNGYASGVNEHGQIVGWAENTVRDSTCTYPQIFQFEAVLYERNGKAKTLPPLPRDPDGAAVAINAAGQVVGISGACNNAFGGYTARHAVIWQNGKPTEIKTFGGHGWNTPTDINSQGQVVGFANHADDIVNGQLQFDPIAFIWSAAAGMAKIRPLPHDTNTTAYAVNDAGQVVGQSSGGPEGARAFLWQNGKSVDLNAVSTLPPNFYLVYAEGINNSGRITGQGCLVNECTTQTRAFIATPVQQ